MKRIKSRNISDRRVVERKSRRQRGLGKRLLFFLSIFGPGLIAANAGNDAGGVATYAQAGASYGYNLLWALLVSSVCVAIVQEMCARMGTVTGKGLADLIREQFGVRWTVLAMLAFLVANTGITISEFLGIGASVQVLANDISTPWIYVVVPISGFLLWWMVTRGSYRRVEKVFIIMSLGFLSYIPAAFAAHPAWDTIAYQTVIPQFSTSSGYLLTAVALVGTTISPYMLFYVQSAVADKGIRISEYAYEQLDIYSGTLFATLISLFMIVATGATLYIAHHPVNSALDAAFALRDLVGRYASLLFGVGLFGASLLAAAVLPLSTAYGICEAFGFERGVSRSFKEAPAFQGIFTGLIVLGVLVTLIPGLPIFQVLIVLQDVNTAMLPILLIFVILLVNNRRLMGRWTNSLVTNILAWATMAFVSVLTLLLLATGIFHIQL